MRRALEYARSFDIPVIDHCRGPEPGRRRAHARGGGVDRASGCAACRRPPRTSWSPATSSSPSSPRGRLHLRHLSTAGALDRVRTAKAEGMAVTCEVTPHHFTLTDEDVAERRRTTPTGRPTRRCASSDHVDAVDGALRRHGRRDRHRPRAAPRRREGARLRRGAVRHRRARDRGQPDLRPAGARQGDRPGAVGAPVVDRPGAGVPAAGRDAASPGSPADVTLLDLRRRLTVDPATFRSRSRNTPFAGLKLRGAPVVTIVGGRIVWRAEG